jgi:hypothetical protein
MEDMRTSGPEDETSRCKGANRSGAPVQKCKGGGGIFGWRVADGPTLVDQLTGWPVDKSAEGRGSSGRAWLSEPAVGPDEIVCLSANGRLGEPSLP